MTVTGELNRVWKEAFNKSNWSVQCLLFGWLWTMIWDMEGKKERQNSPATCHEGLEGTLRYNSSYFRPLRWKRTGGERHVPGALPAGRRSSTHFRGGWVGLVTGRDGSGNFPPTGVRSPDVPGRSGHPDHQEGYNTDICLDALRKTTNTLYMHSKSSSFLRRL